jgi:hypothetical protein
VTVPETVPAAVHVPAGTTGIKDGDHEEEDTGTSNVPRNDPKTAPESSSNHKKRLPNTGTGKNLANSMSAASVMSDGKKEHEEQEEEAAAASPGTSKRTPKGASTSNAIVGSAPTCATTVHSTATTAKEQSGCEHKEEQESDEDSFQNYTDIIHEEVI